MNRRRILLSGAALGVAGCLDFEEGSTDNPNTNGTESPETESSPDDTEEQPPGQHSEVTIYERDEAVERAAHFADTTAPDMLAPSDIEPDTIEFSTSFAGSSSRSGGGGQSVTTNKLVVVPTGDGRLEFGGSTTYAVRVIDRVVDSSVTLVPEPRDEPVIAGRLDINVRGDGELNPESVELRGTNHDDPVVQLTGEWEGDTDLFRHYPFGTYRIELLTDGEVVAHTEERISASRYEWLSAQTSSSLFVTRHGMVDPEWYVELEVGRSPDVVGTVEAIHHTDEHVFEFDLDAIDAEPGTYDWTITVSKSEIASTMGRFLQLSSHRVEPVSIGER